MARLLPAGLCAQRHQNENHRRRHLGNAVAPRSDPPVRACPLRPRRGFLHDPDANPTADRACSGQRHRHVDGRPAEPRRVS